MESPYQTLQLSHDSDEESIRRRYLELIRQFPPEREPERFAEIRAAYEQIRDPLIAMEHRLFDIRDNNEFQHLLDQVRADPRSRRISNSDLMSLGDD